MCGYACQPPEPAAAPASMTDHITDWAPKLSTVAQHVFICVTAGSAQCQEPERQHAGRHGCLDQTAASASAENHCARCVA